MESKLIFIVIGIVFVTGCVWYEEKHIQSIQKPGSEDYVLKTHYLNPLQPSENTPGPNRCINLQECVNFCMQNTTRECRDWIQSIYMALNVNNQTEIKGKYNGIWLPTIDTIRDAIKIIPKLKKDGINIVSFGPDVVTRNVDRPRTVGDNLFKFYVKVFEDAGFNVLFVPNPMHWGNNDASLNDLETILLKWAVEAEKLDAKFYAVFNEVDGMRENAEETSLWIQKVLPMIRQRYSGMVCVQPTQKGFKEGDLNYSGYDCVSTLFPLMTPLIEHDNSEIDMFVSGVQKIKNSYPSVKYVFFTDVHTFHGGNFAETFLMEFSMKEGKTFPVYSNKTEQKEIIRNYLEKAYPYVDGTFLNNAIGFKFIDRPAEEEVRKTFTTSGSIIEARERDPLWATPGLLELIENVTMDDYEREMVMDLNTYIDRPTAGLCFIPTEKNPGPFGCNSTASCMELFRKNPEDYWAWRIDKCGES